MTDSKHITNISAANFSDEVVERSMTRPVLVEFWSESCESCQQLLPILDKLADEYQGGFHLAKVNSDDEPEITSQFGVKSLPTVKILVEAQVVNEFSGVQPEADIRALLDHYVVKASTVHQDALDEYSNGNTDKAIEMLQNALISDPDNHGIKLDLACICMDLGNVEAARALLQGLPDSETHQSRILELTLRIEFADMAAIFAEPLDSLTQKVTDDPKDNEAHYQLAIHLVNNGAHEAAMCLLLKIMTNDRDYKDDIGRITLLKIFDMLGGENPLTQTYRRNMFSLMN